MLEHIFNLKKSKLDGSENIFDHEKYLGAELLPDNFDLRKNCPPIRDQGQEGSCSAFAGTACRTMLAKESSLIFSPADQYWNERKLEGATATDCGASMKDIVTAMKTFGVCFESDMPYVVGKYATPPPANANSDALKHKIINGQMVSSIQGIQTALVVRSQPVLMGMSVFSSMESEKTAQTGILPMPQSGEKNLGGHAVLIVGYIAKLPQTKAEKVPVLNWIKKFFNWISGKKQSGNYFIVRNSWGSSWGDKGYFYMPFEYITSGYADEFWIIE